MEEYKETCKDGVNGFQKAVDSLIDKLMRDLEDQFKEDVKVRQSSESGYKTEEKGIFPFNFFLLFPSSLELQ